MMPPIVPADMDDEAAVVVAPSAEDGTAEAAATTTDGVRCELDGEETDELAELEVSDEATAVEEEAAAALLVLAATTTLLKRVVPARAEEEAAAAAGPTDRVVVDELTAAEGMMADIARAELQTERQERPKEDEKGSG
jgi:hypothetical protein